VNEDIVVASLPSDEKRPGVGLGRHHWGGGGGGDPMMGWMKYWDSPTDLKMDRMMGWIKYWLLTDSKTQWQSQGRCNMITMQSEGRKVPTVFDRATRFVHLPLYT
jgi:hypothetical protein